MNLRNWTKKVAKLFWADIQRRSSILAWIVVSFLWNFFISREASTAERRYRKEKWSENYMHMGAFSTRTHSLLPLSSPPPLSPPFKCDNKGSWPALHFLPLTPPPPLHWIMDRFWQPRLKSRMASILESVSMIAEFGQQQWSYMNFRCRSQDRIFKFSQELVKICAAAKILDTRVNFGRSGRYNQPLQYGRDAAHKSRVAWYGLPLGVYMSERQHFSEDMTESSSARPGGSQQLEIPPSEILTPAKVLSHPYIFTRRLYFVYPPRFSWYGKISGICQYFRHPPEFLWDANILGIRQNFHETPRFYVFANILNRRQILWFCLIFLLQILCIFSVFIYAFEYAPIFLAQLFWP